MYCKSIKSLNFLFFLLTGVVFYFSLMPAVAFVNIDDSSAQNITIGSLTFDYNTFLAMHIKADVSMLLGSSGWSLTPYTKLWDTQPTWVETGIGITYHDHNYYRGASNISVGLTHGQFLTGTLSQVGYLDKIAVTSNASLLFAEGIVISVGYAWGLWDILEYDAYSALYIGLRNNPENTLKLILWQYSFSLGVKPIEVLSFGLHLESITLRANSDFSGVSRWFGLGLYSHFRVFKTFSLRMIGGMDLESGNIDDFYKIIAKIDF